MSLAIDFSWESDRDMAGSNFTDHAGANELKTRIERYWLERGFEVQVMLIEAPFAPALRAARYDVRSEMINGLPRAARKPTQQ